MGIYPNHGLEYHLVLKNDKHIVVLCSQETDDRLVASEYYKSRKESWFQDLSTRCIPIEETVDIEFIKAEKAKLNMLVNTYGDQIAGHGWYDVMTISCSH
jgi:hypothetical protein